jgi:hypothetical protein
VNDRAFNGTDDSAHHYTLTMPALPDTTAEQSHGTARVVSIGQVKEVKVLNMAIGEVDPATLVNVPVLNTYQDFAIDGTLLPRRQVVSTDKCNACHGMLGTVSGSNTLAHAAFARHSAAGQYDISGVCLFALRILTATTSVI